VNKKGYVGGGGRNQGMYFDNECENWRGRRKRTSPKGGGSECSLSIKEGVSNREKKHKKKKEKPANAGHPAKLGEKGLAIFVASLLRKK